MKNKIILILWCFLYLNSPIICYGEQTLIVKKVVDEPRIDGRASDTVWAKAEGIITHDNVADIDIILKAAYTDKKIFFLVVFPDENKSIWHKSWVWNKDMEVYRIGKDREDTFIFKWNMLAERVDLSVYSCDSYVADIWFWKANRTNPSGYADDKIQKLSESSENDKSKKIICSSGHTMFLSREGDKGESAYKETLPTDYTTSIVEKYMPNVPTESRADIKAKGIWSMNTWTIEFSRFLKTGNEDDIQFNIGEISQFGVSRHEIAGREPDHTAEQFLYGTGDVSEDILLTFEQ